MEAITGRRPRHAILKGRTNYACLLRVRDSTAQDQGALISASDLADTIRSAPLSYAGVGARRGRAGAPGVGRGTGRRAGSGRSRRCPVAHRPGLAAGVDPGARVPRAATVPLRRRVLRRTVPRRGPGGGPGGHQPCVAGHQCDARRHRAARTQCGHHRRGPRTGGPGDRRGLGGTESGAGRKGRQAGAHLPRGRRGARAAGVGRCPADRPGRDAARADRGSGFGVRRRVRHGTERGAYGGQRDDRR